MKTCNVCNEQKKITDFRVIQGLKKNGRFNTCKICKENEFNKKIIDIGGQEYLDKANTEFLKTRLRSRTLLVDWEVCKAHIEKQFTKGMSWSNQGKWHIDHIIPLASAKNEDELMKLCHYRNLQPLWAEDNLKKSAKIQGQQTYFKL